MSTKRKTTTADTTETVIEDTEMTTVDSPATDVPAEVKPDDQPKAKGGRHKLEQNLDMTVLVEDGKALKLNPAEPSHVYYQIGVEASGEIYIRISGNETGGLHSKEWVSVPKTLEILDAMPADQVFKSTQFKGLFQSGSNNNAGFYAAILRCPEVGLIKPGETGIFVHKIADDYEDKKAALLALATG